MSRAGAEAKRRERDQSAPRDASADASAPLVTVYAVVRQRHADGRVGGIQLVECEVPESALAHGKRSAPAGAWEVLAQLDAKLQAMFLRGGP